MGWEKLAHWINWTLVGWIVLVFLLWLLAGMGIAYLWYLLRRHDDGDNE